MSSELMILGAEYLEQPSRPWWQPLLAMAAGGALAAALWRKHWLLAAILGTTIGRNAYGVVIKERTWETAGRNIGSQCVAIAGSLALPSHPAVGYLAGAVAGDVLIDGHGGGLLEQWVKALKGDVKVSTTSTALVPVERSI